MILSRLFHVFFESEKTSGILLILCTAISLLLANSVIGESYSAIWLTQAGGHSITHWINDGLMAIFFLMIGLELEREIYYGELSDLKNARLPIIAAIGGVLIPAGIYLMFNWGTPLQKGAGIPTATDIAFAIGILSLLGKRVPASLKVFLTALAVIDDLIAILIIAVFYTDHILWSNLSISLGILLVLFILNRLKIYNLIPYLIGGVFAWYYMLHSGVHATIAGVLLAYVIPFGSGKPNSPSYILQHSLHKPVSFIIIPLFALANTCIVFQPGWLSSFNSPESWGIIGGLLIGKPVGIFLFSFIAVSIGLCSLPPRMKWKHILGAGLLGGIGFTMSIFVTLLAFKDPVLINTAKISVLLASLLAGLSGFTWLHLLLKKSKN